MIRLIHCVRKRDDITIEEFRHYWQSPEFDRLIERAAELTRARRYARNATLVVDANLWIMETRNIGEPFDGVIEYWYENAAHLMKIFADEPFHVLRTEMEIFQHKFLNLEKALIFFTEGEQVVC